MGLTKAGPGTLVLTGSNSFSGPITVSGGTLQGSAVAFPTAITLAGANAGAANVTFYQGVDASYASSINGTGSFTKAGANVLTLTASQGYSGATCITAGTLILQGGPIYAPGLVGQYYANVGGNWPNPTNAVNVGDGGLTLTNFNNAVLTLYLDQTVNTTVRAAQLGNASFFISQDHTMWDQTPGSQPYQSNVDNFVIRWTGFFVPPMNGSYTLSTNADDRSIIWLNNSNTQFCSSNNNQSSNTINNCVQGVPIPITIAFQEWGGDDYIGVNVQGPLGSGLESNPRLPNSVLEYATGNTQNVLPSTTAVTMSPNTTLALSGGGMGQQIASLADAVPGNTSGHQVLLGGGTLTVGDANSTTFSGAISGSGASWIIKTGAGTWTLTGTNTHQGGTSINQGILSVASDTALGATGPAGAALQFNGGMFQPSLPFSSNRPVNVAAGGGDHRYHLRQHDVLRLDLRRHQRGLDQDRPRYPQPDREAARSAVPRTSPPVTWWPLRPAWLARSSCPTTPT